MGYKEMRDFFYDEIDWKCARSLHFVLLEFASYPNANTLYVIGRSSKEAIESVELASNDLMEWFPKNKMKVNPDKFHLLTSWNDKLKICIADDVVNST